MASVLAKKKLLDIAQGMGKKKTEEEQRLEKEKVLNSLKEKALAKQAGASIQAGVSAAKAPVKAYAENKYQVMNQQKAIEEAEKANAEYIRQYNPSLPTDKATYENTAYSHDQELVDRRGGTLEKEHAEYGQRAAEMRRYEDRNPQAKKTMDALYALLNRGKLEPVNPIQNAAPLKGESSILRSTAAAYEPGSWQEERQGKPALELADELDRRVGIIEDPVKALEEVNADIAKLESMKPEAGKGAYMGVEHGEFDNVLNNAYKQKTLLEMAVFDSDAVELPEKKDDDFLSGLDQNAMHALSQYGIPEGTRYADFDQEDWVNTIHLTADELKKYNARKMVDPEGAKAWLEVMMPTINERRAKKQAENTAEMTERLPVTANLMAVASTLTQPIGSVYALAQQLRGEEVDPNSKWFGADRFTGAVRGTTESMIDEKVENPIWNKVAKIGYNVTTSAADNAARLLLYGGMGIQGNAATGLMAFGTYGNSVAQAMENGATSGEAALLGVIQAGVEYVTEWLPDATYMRLLNNRDVKGMGQIMKDVASAVLGDGFGEAANSLISTIAEDWLIENGSSIDDAVNLYMFRGEAQNVEEATRMAWKDAMQAALYEGLIGAMSAGLLSGGMDLTTSAIGKAQEKKAAGRAKLEEIAAQKAAEEQQAARAAQEKAQAQEQEALGEIAQSVAAIGKPESKVTEKTPAQVQAQKKADDEMLREKQLLDTIKMEREAEKRSEDSAKAVRTDNGYTVEKNGQTVNLDEMDADDVDARMLQSAGDMTEDAANDMLSAYVEQENVSAEEYAKGYRQAYEAGKRGEALESVRKLYAEDLTEAQLRSAWAYGREARNAEAESVKRKTQLYAGKAGIRAHADAGAAGVSAESITRELSEKEGITMKLLDAFGKKYGLQFRVYDTLDRGAANASYIAGTNVVNVALDAQDGALTRAASHETYHYIESFSQEDAKAIRAFVLDKLRNVEGYDLDARIAEKKAQYERAGVKDFDAESEIVADSLLDIIGTEENIMDLAKKSPTLLNKIREVVDRIRAFLQEQLDKLTLHNEEAAALYGDKEYIDRMAGMMNRALENAKENRAAQMRVTQTAANDADVQAYLKDLGDAENAQQRANLLESLTSQVYLRTQMDMIQKTGDYEGGMQPFKDALKAFAEGKGNLNALLKEAGLDMGKSAQDNAVMAWLARERERVEDRNAQQKNKSVFSLQELPNGMRYVEVDTDQHIFAGIDESRYMSTVRQYMKDHYRNRVIGNDTRAYFKRDAEGEYTNPAKHNVDEEIFMNKMRAATELDNMMDAAQYVRHEEDRHGNDKVVGGWDYYNVIYHVNGKYYRGEIQTYNIKRGKLFHDITQIKDITAAMTSDVSKGHNNISSGDVFKDSLAEGKDYVNKKFSLKMTPALKKQENVIYEQKQKLRNEETQLRRKLHDFKNDAKTLELVERVMNAETRVEKREARKEYSAHAAEYGVNDAEERIREIDAEIRSLSTKEDEIRAEALNNTVKDSGKTEAEYFEKEAVKEFGYTPYFVDAGYILKNGKMLNFSGEKGKHYGNRGQDHRAVSILFEGTKSGTEAMIAFMRYGNVRIMDETPGIDVSTVEALTKEQIDTIKKHVRESAGRGLYVVDFDDADGRTIDTLTYEGRVKADRVIADILHYYETGEIREQSVVSMFRSLKDEDASFFAEMSTDEEVREAGKLINRLHQMRKEEKVQPGAWSGKTTDVSKKILADTNSSMNQAVLTRKINTMYKAMDAGDVTPRQLMEYAYDVAQKVAEGASQVQELGEGEREARDYIRNTRIYLDADMQSEVRAQYGDLRKFYSKHYGTAKFTTDSNATSLEEMWGELHRMAPGYFKEDTKNSEMPMVLEGFLEATGKVARDYFGASEEQLKQDVAMRLFWEYYSMPGTYGDLKAQEKEMVQQLADLQEGLRDTFEQRVQEKVENYKAGEEKRKQRAMLERNVKAMTKRLMKPTKSQHIPEEMRGTVAKMLELVNTGGNKRSQQKRTEAYNELLGMIAKLRETDTGLAYVDPDMEAHIEELRNNAAGKSVMSMSLEELKDLNRVVTGIRHACTVSDQLLTAGHKGSVAAIADDARSMLDTMKDRKVRGDLASAAIKVGKYAMEDAPRFFQDLARYTGKAGKDLWDIVRHGGLDKQIRLLKEAEKRVGEIHRKYKGYEKWMSRNSKNHTFQTESGEINLTTGQVMALYLLNKRPQARNHIYGIKGTDGGIAQGRVKTKNGMSESVRPSKVNEAQVNKIIDSLSAEQKAFADEMGKLLSGWCADLGNEVSMQMYGYKKFTEENYFPIKVWGGRTDATSGENRQNQLYLIMNKGFTKEVQDKAQAPMVIPDMFDAVTEHVNGMIVYNAWTAPVTDMIKFINYKFRDDSMTVDQNGNEVFAPGQNIIGTVKEDLSRVMGNGAEKWYVQLIEDINGLAKNRVEKDVTGFVNKLTRNYKAAAVGWNIGTMLKQPTSVIRAFDVIPPMYFAGKPIVPNKQRQAIMEKYAPIVTWKGYGNFTMDTGKSIERILFPESSTLNEHVNEWSMAGAGYMDTVTWHNIWAAAERMAAKKNKNLQRGTDAFYKKTAEIFNQCIDQTQTVDSILHRSQMMRQDTAWIKSVTAFMGEPIKAYNMLLDAVNDWKTTNTKERARKVSKTAGVFVVSAMTTAFVNSLVGTLFNWDDEDPFWDQVWQRMFGNYTEDMTTWQKFKEAAFNSELISELNVLNYIPVARDVMESLAGHDVERIDMSLVADTVDAMVALGSEKTATPEKIMNMAAKLSNLLNLQVGSLWREAKRMWNWGNQQLEAFGLDTLESQYAYLKAQKNIGASGNLTDYANLLLKAEKEGRTDLVKRIRTDMLEAGAEEEDIDNKMYKLQVQDLTGIKNASYEKTYAALGEAMRAKDKQLVDALTKELKRAGRTDEQIENGLIAWLKEDPRVISAAQKAVKGDTTEKVKMAKTLRDEGFSDAVGKKAINQLQNKMVSDSKKETEPEEETKEPAYEALYTYYDLQMAIEDGDDVSEIMDDLREQGKEDSSIKSGLTSRIKPVYVALMNGTASDKAKAKKIKEMLLSLDLKNKYTGDAIDKWLKESTEEKKK